MGRRRMILFIYSKNMAVRSLHTHCFCINMEFIMSKSIVFLFSCMWIQMGIINIYQKVNCSLNLLGMEYICFHPIMDGLMGNLHMIFYLDQNMHFNYSFSIFLYLCPKILVDSRQHNIILYYMVNQKDKRIVDRMHQMQFLDYNLKI